MDAGQEAAVLGLGTFLASLIRSTRASPLDRLSTAIIAANEQIYALLRGRGGTTLTAALVTRHHGTYFCHVGDSRLFAIGPERMLHQLTRDDTLAALLQKPNPEPRRDSRLLQFVGMGEEMEPQISEFDWRLSPSLLLTTDGAHDIPTSMLERVVTSASSPLDLARKLTQLSDMLGGADNSSVIILPSKLDDEVVRSEGLELTVMLPADEVTIWVAPAMQMLGTENQVQPTPPADKALSSGRKPSDPQTKTSPPREERSKRSSTAAGKPRKSKNSRKKAMETQLPLGDKVSPEVNVEFPDEQRGQG